MEAEDETGSSFIVVDDNPSIYEEPWDAVTAEVLFQPDAPPTDVSSAQGIAEAGSVLAQIKQLITKTRKDAFADLRQEFDVQVQIWQSAALLEAAKRKSKSLDSIERPEKEVAGQLEGILKMLESDAGGAIRRLEQVLDGQARSEVQLVGTSLLKVARATVKMQKVSVFRDTLREQLEAASQTLRVQLPAPGDGRGDRRGSMTSMASVPDSAMSETGATAPVGSMDGEEEHGMPSKRKAELEDLFKACEIEDAKIEYCARRVLGLAMSVNAMSLGAKCELGDGDLMGFLSGSFRSQSTDPWG